ncbi:PREDICTED: inner centromere protein A-like isoform X2 [Priapulus caudatus]|uniref:Inner centromere protein A-like isoform X2 n=1 Tax=Priapulus caudatus TaxID=37621 RepID=A0ABM1FB53_PRICU|nr:PREDICTED: inner centromere protein A-like isoform X2 [Priapulus caudatus]
MARSTTDSYSVHLETIKNIADFKTRTEAHFTWLEEILVESKRAFARPDIEPLPKTPGTKRGRCRQIKAVPKYCNEDEDENNDSLSKATHEPKARRKLTVETHVDAALSIPDDAIAEEGSDVVLECKRGRPQRVASPIASMKWSMQLEIMKRKRLPSQQRLASMSATCLAEVERIKPNQNKLRNVAFSEQPPQQQAEPQDAPVVELHSDSDKESEAEVEPVPKKKPKRCKLSRKKRNAKSSIIHIVESDTEEEPLAEELGCSDSTNSDVFEAGSPTETEQAMAVGVALSPVIVLDRIEVFDPETPKVSKPLNQVVDIKPAADEIHVSKAAITDTVSTPTTQLLLGQSSKQMTPTTPTERFSPYASPPVKSRVKAFEAIAENASIVNISHSSAANTSVNKSILMHQSESVSSSPVDPKMMSAKVMVTNIVCAIKHKYHQIIGTPEKADCSMEQSSVIHASSDTDGEQATEKSAQTNVIKPDSNEPHAPLEMIVEDSVERVCGAVDKEAIVSLHNLSKQEIAEIQRPSLSGDTTEVCRLSNERRSAGRSSVSRRSGRRSSVSRRSGRLSSAMLNRASLQHGHRRSSLLGKKLMKQAEEMQMIKDVKQAAAELRRSSRRSRSIALTDEEMPPPLPTVPPVSKPIRSARTKVQQPKMDVKDLPVVDSNEEAEEPEQTSEPAPQRVTRTKVRQPKMDVKDLPVVDSNEEAEVREQTSEPVPQRVTRTKVRQPKMDVKDLPVVDSNEEAEEPEQTSEPAPQRVTRTKTRQMLKSRTSPCSSPSVAACNQVANSAPDGLGKGRQLEESEEERGVATPTEARPRQTTRAVDQNARCRAETPVDRGSSSQKSTDNEASDFCTPPERPMRITRSKMPKKGVAADVASGKPPIHPVAMTDSDGGKRSSRKRPSDSHLSGSARAKQARFKHNGQATNIIRMSRKPNGGKTSSDSDSETVGDGGSADRQPTRTRGAQVVNPGSERRITPNTCPSNKIIRPGVKTFIGSASKRPANLVEKEARRQHELRRKKEKEEQAARKRREMLQELALEKKRKREESARRVLETRLARQHAEQEKKALLLESRLHRRNPQERERQEKLLQEKQELRMQRQQNAQEKRIQENDQRLNRIREQEEEKLRHDAMFIRKRDFEEQERQEKLAEQKRLQDEKLADLERQRIDELDRQQRIEQEKQREWQRQKEEKELVLEKERQQRKRMELERQREKDRLAQKEIEKQREIARQHLLKEAEEKRQAEEDRKRQEEVARLIQKHNNALKVVNSTANLNSTYNNSSAMGQQAKKNNIDSYELTPKAVKPKLRKTDCYNINDLHSDDSTDNEDEPRKRIPDWAQGVQLKTAIISQHYEMPDINEIFDVMDMPKLEDMFVKLRARFHKRTSSAHWRTPIQHPGDEYSFLDNSMHP